MTHLAAVSIAAAIAVIIGMVVVHSARQRALSPAALGHWRNQPITPLNAEELAGLHNWHHRLAGLFLLALGYLGLLGFLNLYTQVGGMPFWSVADYSVLALIAAVVAVQFSGTCPRCGYHIGLSSRLMIPGSCERCGVEFRPPGHGPQHSH